MPHFIAVLLLLAATSVSAQVALIGTIGDKAAVLAVDGGDPKTVKVGQTWNGVTVLSVERTSATVAISGKQRVLNIGQHHRGAAAVPDRASVTLAADPRGHFMADGLVNGVPVHFMVDTGATVIALPAADAQRAGIDYLKGARGMVSTASGPAAAYRIRLDTVKLGTIELTGLEGVVIEQGLDVALLGMSFLNRVEMRREGPQMMLIRRF
jgi:aspartyl protease family protein